MNTELKNSITATNKEAQYDASAKRLLGQKIILAHILSKTIPEFMGMKPSDIVSFIEGEPYISTVPVDPGLTKDDLISKHNWHGNLDLLNIIMVGISNNLPPHDDTYEMHRLLSALLSIDLSVNEKLDIIGNEYDIPMENNLREDVNVMCNLSQGIKEVGIAIGEARGKAIGKAEGRAEGEATAEAKIVINMHNNGLAPEQIATFTNKDIDDVKAIISGNIPALAK